MLYDNGTLDVLITTLKDSGAFSCVASNAAGIATAAVEINMIPLPLLVNNTGHMREDPGLSDITTSAKSGNDTKGQDKQDRRVVVAELTSSSAVIRWPSERHIPGIRMYQIQYNCTVDETLIYRSVGTPSPLLRCFTLFHPRCPHFHANPRAAMEMSLQRYVTVRVCGGRSVGLAL